MGSYLGKYSSRRDIHQAFTISIIKPVSSIQDIECRLLDSSSYTIHKRPVRSSVSLPATMPGFDFSNHTRNAALHSRGVPLPKATSTGTTIVGCIFDGGVVILQTPGQRVDQSWLIRTARSFITSLLRSGVPELVLQQIPNSQPPSSLHNSSSTPSQPAASHESLPV